ncbi:PorV/PorQ family protein [Sphingobacteriales bacterium CHB3]|nr:PorV/PorQ family protein [Sphingobacteriales bacterium CHB3]
MALLGLLIRYRQCSVLLLILLTIQPGFSQTRKGGLTGAAFLKVGVGARAVGLGSAATALTGDVNQMFWNPAGIALQPGDALVQATFGYHKWIAGLGHHSAAVSYNWENVGTFGVGFISFGISGIPADRDVPVDPALIQFQVDRNTSATYDYRDVAFQLSVARYFTDRLSLGITAKIVSQSIDGLSTGALAFDAGSVYAIGVLDWKIAARFSNLGSDLKFYDIAYGLPLSFSIGTALSPLKSDEHELMLALDAVKPQDGPQYFFSGVEYTFMNVVSVRGGWKFNYSGTDDGGNSSRSAINSTIEGLSVGAGVRTTVQGFDIGVDYSFTKMELLSAAHRFSLQLGMK